MSFTKNRSSILKKTTVYLTFLLVFTFVACHKTESSNPAAGSNVTENPLKNKVAPRVGYKAPDFTLRDLDGNQISLSDWKDHVIMLNFWATWCGPCKMEMPSMQELEQELQGEKFKIIAIANDTQGERVVKPYINKYGYTFTNLIDNSFEVNDVYKISSIPTTILIDRDGVISNKLYGARSWDSPRYKDLILKLIRSK